MTCTGQTAFDYIIDYDEWIECGYFDDEIKARLKGKWNQRAPPLLHTQINSLKKFSIFKLHFMWNVCLHLVLYWKYFIFTAYNLKHSRDLVRAISKKVKTIPFHPLRPRYPSTLTSSPHSTSPHPLTPTIMPSSSHFSAGTFDRVSGILPAINRRTSVAVGYLIDRQSL